MKMYDKKGIAIVLIITLLFSVLPMSAFAEQADTVEGVRVEGDTWYVSTTEGLLAWNNAANTVLATSGSSINLVLGANLDITGVEWTPIGNEDAPYTGIIDGKDYTITGLTITNTTWEDVGFFGDLALGGIVQNLNLENINIVLNEDKDVYVGGIAGYVWDDALISNCSVSGKIVVDTDAGERTWVYAGGIAGLVSGSTVSSCSSAATINITGSHQAFAGGIAGENNSLITACENTGNITVYTQSGSGTCAYVGGIAGYDIGLIDSCASSGTLIANGAKECYTGEIAAYSEAYVYIGGKALPESFYMDNDGNISTEKPNGGYAYYNGSYLILKDFLYEGDGFVYGTYSYEVEDEAGSPVTKTQYYAAAVYFSNGGYVWLAGENTLCCTYGASEPDDNRENCSVGIASDHGMTLIDIQALFSSSNAAVLNIEAGLGIDCGRDMVMMDGILNITANDFDGIYANNDVWLFDAKVNIDAAQYGIYAYGSVDGDVHISGSDETDVISITAGDGYEAIFAFGELDIDEVLTITIPKDGKAASIEQEYINEEGTYMYQTITDVKGNPACTVEIAPKTAVEDDGNEDIAPPSYVYSGGNTIPEVKAEVITSDANVSIQTKQISTAVLNDVKGIVAENDALRIIGGKDYAVQITAKENGDLVEHFAQPVTVTVPVSKTDLKQVKDTGKLTLALVVTDENGAASLTCVGGKYDVENGTFRAYTAEPGNYVLVEKDDLIKIELTIDQTVADVNDKPVEKDVPAQIIDNRTFAPLRFVLEHMDCDVYWNGETRTVTLTLPNDACISMTVDKPLPGFGVAPIIESGRTLVPIAYIAYAMDAYVLWVEDAQKVVIVK